MFKERLQIISTILLRYIHYKYQGIPFLFNQFSLGWTNILIN